MIHDDKVILLVDDSADDIELTVMALEEANVVNRIVVARDGVEALEYLYGTGTYEGRDISDQPQVILLDLKMPRMDGLEVLRRLRADDRTKRLPIVILTSSDEESDRIASYEEHVNSYIRKPVDFERFIEAVRQVGAYWLVLNETA
jgi:two-component system, response regulator